MSVRGLRPDHQVLVRRASKSKKPVLRRLLELYRYDLSRIDRSELDDRGRYGYHYLDHYWRERGRFPYLIAVNDSWAGFALVNKRSPLPGADWAMAEFFVLARYRRRGVGEQAARWLFDQHRGTWHVAELAGNKNAQAFWRRVIRRYTAGRFEERSLRDDRWRGLVQVFRSPPA